MRRVVVISDLHCGNPMGVVPPNWQEEEYQTEFYNWLTQSLESMKPIDVLVVNGDAIDGDGRINSGTELITTDRLEQVEMARQVIEIADPNKILMTTGTPYHVGSAEDFEKVLADKVDATFKDHITCTINNLKFDIRHHTNSSSVPHGRYTPLAKSALWNVLDAYRKESTGADVLIRSHVHYHAYCADPTLGLSMTTPALQLDSRFGKRRCEGIIDIGFVYFDIESKENWTWGSKLLHPTFNTEETLIV